VTAPGHRRVVVEDRQSRWTPYRVGWLSLLLVVVLARIWMMRSWSWLQDDLLLTSWTTTKGFGDYVLTDFAGHVLTGEMLIAWTFTKLDPLNWFWPGLTIVVFSALVVVGWGLALREIFGEKLHLLLAIVVITLTPGMTAISLWWISCLNLFPMIASMGFASWFLARYLLGDQRRRNLVGMNLSYALGLLMWEKSLLVTVPLFFLVFMLGPPTVRRAIPVAIRLLWPTALVTVGYLAFFLWSISDPEGEIPGKYTRSVGGAVELVQHGAVDVTLPSIFGGPFQTVGSSTSAFGETPMPIAVVLVALTVALIVIGAVYRRRGWIALGMIATYAAIAWGLVFFSGRFHGLGAGITAIPRYSADLLPVVMLGCLFLVTPTRVETEPLRRPMGEDKLAWIRRALVIHLVLATSVALVTTTRYWNRVEPTSTKPYMDNLVSDAEGVGAADVFDDTVPQTLVSGILLPDASRFSQILAPLDLPLRYNQPTDQFLMFGPEGHLWEADVDGGVRSVTPGPDGDCGYGIDKGETVSIPLDGQPFAFVWGAQITYFTGSDATIGFETEAGREELELPVNEAGGVGKRQFVIPGAVDTLTVEGISGKSTVCITEVRIGPLKPTDRVPEKLRAES